MTNSTDIRPYRIEIPQADLDDLHDRLARTRWPSVIEGTGWERGVPVPYLKGLAEYWRTEFDWRAQEAKLNEFAQFVTTVDGQDIHFLHVRSPEPDALPLILTHGWPSSVVEFTEMIGPLTDPAAYGGDPADAFHVVVPSIPGYGFSTPVREVGWGNLFRVAQAFAEVMSRLGYERFAAQGGDVGAGVTAMLAMLEPQKVVATHTNGPAPYPFGPPVELEGLSDDEQLRAERFNQFQADGLGYLHLQSTRPQTIGYGLADSPVQQLAWIAEKFKEWTDPAAELPDDAVDRDRLLTNVSIYWFTATAGSSANRYSETFHDPSMFAGPPERSPVPTAVAVFPMDPPIRRFAEPVHTIVRWTEFDRGGHFAAMEAPDLLIHDVREFFRQLSPITHIDNVRAPAMVLHGANDPRDPVEESDRFVAAIRDLGGEVQYLRFPDEGHSIRRLENRIIAYRRIAGFLEETLEVR
jgi:pimeloyl-ACP methyl ester carboxylesterase